MLIDIITYVNINLPIEEYALLVEEMCDFVDNEDSSFVGTIESILEDLENNMKILSEFSVISKLYFKEISEFFLDYQDDIEDIDNDEYPLLSNLLITIGNNV